MVKMNENENNIEEESKKPKRGSKKDYPVIKFSKAFRVAEIIQQCGGYASPKTLETELNARGGNLARQIASAKRWGLIDGHGVLKLTELAKKILFPKNEGEVEEAKRDAFDNVEFFKNIYERFEGNFPEDKLFKNILIREHQLKPQEAIKVVNLIKDAVSGLSANEEMSNHKETSASNRKTKDTGEFSGFFRPKQSRIGESDFEVIGDLFYIKALIDKKCELSNDEKNKKINELIDISSNYSSLKMAITPMTNLLKNQKINEDVFLSEIDSFIEAIKKDLNIPIKNKETEE